MKNLTLLILSIFIILNFTACSSKTQTDVINSKSEDISTLLDRLIKKEQEIAELNQKLEDCKNQK